MNPVQLTVMIGAFFCLALLMAILICNLIEAIKEKNDKETAIADVIRTVSFGIIVIIQVATFVIATILGLSL